MKFTQREVRDLGISTLVIALVFSAFDITMILPMIFIVFAVFVSHEILGHKLMAQHFECDAEYRMWPLGLGLGLVTGLLGGFIFVAPGAVYISPVIRKKFAFTVARLNRKQYGIIAAAGPFVNIMIAFALIGINMIYPWFVFSLTAKISFFLALFNLIPFPPLDGQKIMGWDRKVWLALLASSIIGYSLLIYL